MEQQYDEEVIVFGCNLLGVHGAGSAKKARDEYGAQLGVGEGPTGRAYAIPTKRTPSLTKRQFKLSEISESVDRFLLHARNSPRKLFLVTKIGCGLAGYKDHEIAPMFN